ncbi:MAG: PTS sugar transporter subunit IIA [Candidatus Sabulitectum sp.]|nr:PTS sugar transporter subunit IIA [Candidatus Sabulitectum sp.]
MKYAVLCKFELSATSREEAIAELLALFPAGEKSRGLLAGALDVRENVGATVVHNSIALPHCRSILVDKLTIAVGKSPSGIPWPEEMVKTVILFVSSVKPSAPQEHSKFLGHIAGKIKNSGDKITAASNQNELLDLLGFQPEEQGE